jgi:5-methylcytosine-specific restriction enzyme subunit McrC
VRTVSLREYQTSAPVELSVQQRDLIRALVPDLRIEPAPGAADAYLLTPGSCIGAVTAGHLALEIAPKLSIERVLFLVSHSLGLAKWGPEPFQLATPDSLVEALVPVFAHHLERALRRGVLQGYRTEEDSLMTVRGRIRFDDQVRRRFGIVLPVEVRFDEFSEDILENRLLKSALSVLGGLRLRSDTSRQTLRRFNHALELVAAPAFDSQNVPAVIYTPLNEHYRGAVEWARLILRFASVESRHGEALGTAVMFDMNDVFEDFVRTALRERLNVSVGEFPDGRHCRSLFLDAAHRVSLEPDLSWWMGARCRFVGDVKYKVVNVAGIKHPDLYQLLAYTTASGLTNGLLVYAAGEGEAVTHEIPMAGKGLYVRALRLGGSLSQLRFEVRQIATLIETLVNARQGDARGLVAGAR